jgi:hypothetical protein
LFPMCFLIMSGCVTTTVNNTCIKPDDLVDVQIPPAPPKAARNNARLADDFVELQSAVIIDNKKKEKLRNVLVACQKE